MERAISQRNVIQELDLTGLPQGQVLQPMERPSNAERAIHEAWERPLAPWGGFAVDSGIGVGERGGRTVLYFEPQGRWERAVVARGIEARDCRIRAEMLQTKPDATPNDDRDDVTEAIGGVVFRWETSRRYYQFALEGRRRAVLYRRCDDEWHALAEQSVEPPDDEFVTFEVVLSGDAIRCRCEELGVDFFATDTAYHSGKLGMRSHGGAEFASFSIEQSEEEQSRDAALLARERAAEAARGGIHSRRGPEAHV